MKLVRHATAEDFWQAAGPLLSADPVRNTIALTVVARLLIGGTWSGEQPTFLTVHHEGAVVGAAFSTPPFPLNVTGLPTETMPLVIDHLTANDAFPRAVSGLRPEIDTFVALWSTRTGAVVTDRVDERLYRLGELTSPADVPGEPALATTTDLDLLVDWRLAFVAEADDHRIGGQSVERVTNQIRDSLALGNAQLVWWVDGRPVSHAAVNAPRNGMSRVGPVYTPKEYRNRGYGAAVTAAASRWALDRGAEHVLLFTDLSNPVSNSIYQKIGYAPVVDALDVTFGPGRLP